MWVVIIKLPDPCLMIEEREDGSVWTAQFETQEEAEDAANDNMACRAKGWVEVEL